MWERFGWCALDEIFDSEVDKIIEAFSLNAVFFEFFDYIVGAKESVVDASHCDEIARTNVVDVWPVFGKSFGSGFEEIVAEVVEALTEFGAFDDVAVFIDVVEDGLSHGFDDFRFEADSAGTYHAVVGLDVDVVATGVDAFAVRGIDEDAHVGFKRAFIGWKAYVAIDAIGAILDAEMGGFGVEGGYDVEEALSECEVGGLDWPVLLFVVGKPFAAVVVAE